MSWYNNIGTLQRFKSRPTAQADLGNIFGGGRSLAERAGGLLGAAGTFLNAPEYGYSEIAPMRAYANEQNRQTDTSMNAINAQRSQVQGNATNTPTNNSTLLGGGGGGGGGAATTPTFSFWMGQRYNLNDPNQAAAYAQARSNFINEQYGYGMNQGQQSVNQQLGDWGQDYLSQIQNLGKSKESRDMAIAKYFSTIAPSMYQSAEGQGLQESQQALTEGTSEANRQKTSAESQLNNWWTDTQRSLQQQRQQQLDEINNALSGDTSSAVQSRIAQMASPTAPTASPLNIQSYFDKLSSAVGSAPQSTINSLTAPAKTSLTNLVNKISQGIALTPEELTLAQQYGI